MALKFSREDAHSLVDAIFDAIESAIAETGELQAQLSEKDELITKLRRGLVRELGGTPPPIPDEHPLHPQLSDRTMAVLQELQRMGFRIMV